MLSSTIIRASAFCSSSRTTGSRKRGGRRCGGIRGSSISDAVSAGLIFGCFISKGRGSRRRSRLRDAGSALEPSPSRGGLGGDGVDHVRHSGGSRNPFCVWPSALRDNRLTSVCGSSTIHGRRLLSFACPKESNQRKRHPRIRALAVGEGSLRADGFRPQAIHGLLSKSARSLAPPACGARGWSVRPSPLLRGDPESEENKSEDEPRGCGLSATESGVRLLGFQAAGNPETRFLFDFVGGRLPAFDLERSQRRRIPVEHFAAMKRDP